MDKVKVQEIVERHFRENVAQFEGKIDISRSMLEQGASSLDSVEITSGAMREMGVKIPRTQLSKAKTIDDLIAMLSEAANAK